jgi:UDP-N-acetylmuramoylalanine--D-glutamate ligase
MMKSPREIFEGKKVTIMGLGLLGRGLGDTLFLLRSGAIVTVTDLKTPEQLAPSLKRLEGLPVKLHLGGHDPADFINADMILRNADVPRSSLFLKTANDHGVPVEMDESLFCKNFEGTIVGITGTRGKTTTTTLIYNVLLTDRPGVHISGNIMGHATLPLLKTVGGNDTVVLELSSWQLQGFHDSRISPHASVFTNVYPDHMNRYSGMDDYIQDKKAIFLYQKENDFCVFNGDQVESGSLLSEAPGQKYVFRIQDVPLDWKIQMPGKHNRANVAAVVCLCRQLGVKDQVIREAVEKFSGVEHRLQWLGEKNGVGFVNDSTSTTPVAGCAALDSMGEKHILLVAGGSDKNLDLSPFALAAASKAHKIALLDGSATAALRSEIISAGGKDKVLGVFDNLKDAVYKLLDDAKPGYIVLLSPGCSSFGMFQNEFHRGESFISLVRQIME